MYLNGSALAMLEVANRKFPVKAIAPESRKTLQNEAAGHFNSIE
jgi:hypothetical protein